MNQESNSPIAVFQALGDKHYVRVSAATEENRIAAREYLAKVIQYRYYDHILFDRWIEEAQDDVVLHDLDAAVSPTITEFLTSLSEMREVVNNAVRE